MTLKFEFDSSALFSAQSDNYDQAWHSQFVLHFSEISGVTREVKVQNF
jgi:hypothetical protein